jgi:hypothetical protein
VAVVVVDLWVRLGSGARALLSVRRLMLYGQAVGADVRRAVRRLVLSLAGLVRGAGVVVLLVHDTRRPRVLKVRGRLSLLRVMGMML